MAIRHRVAGVAAVLATLATVVLATGEGAYAASRTVTDATGDVLSIKGEHMTTVSGPEGDITSVTTTHSAKTVRVKVRARHLPLGLTSVVVKLRTAPTGPAYLFAGTADVGMRSAILARGQHILVCPGIRLAYRPMQGYAMAVIPRTCLGTPKWVQAGAGVSTGPSLIEALANDDTDSLADGEVSGTIDVVGVGSAAARSGRLPLGPKVHVG